MGRDFVVMLLEVYLRTFDGAGEEHFRQHMSVALFLVKYVAFHLETLQEHDREELFDHILEFYRTHCCTINVMHFIVLCFHPKLCAHRTTELVQIIESSE